MINIGQDEYTEKFGEEAGARVVVHSQDNMPFPEDEGTMVKAGSITNLGIKRVTVSRKGPPYGTCTEYDEGNTDYSKNVYEEMYPVKYSKMVRFTFNK